MRSIADRLRLARSTASPIIVLKFRVFRQAPQVGRDVPRPGEFPHHFLVRHDQGDQMRPAVAANQRLAHLALQEQHAFDARWRHIVSARIDDHVLLAVGDLQIALGIDLADVAGVQPPVAQCLGGCLGIFPVAAHDQIAAHQDLAVVGNPRLDPVQRGPDGIEFGTPGTLALITGDASVWP